MSFESTCDKKLACVISTWQAGTNSEHNLWLRLVYTVTAMGNSLSGNLILSEISYSYGIKYRTGNTNSITHQCLCWNFDNNTTYTIQHHACQTWSHDYWCVTDWYWQIDKAEACKSTHHKNSRQLAVYKLTCNFSTLPSHTLDWIICQTPSDTDHTDAYVCVNVSIAAYLCGLPSVGWENF